MKLVKKIKSIINKSWKSISTKQICDPTSNGEIRVLRKIIQEGVEPVVIFDIGANKGDYIRLAEKYSENKKIIIHAFEPQAYNFNLLSGEFGNNKNIYLNQSGLSDKTGSTIIYADSPGSPLASFYNRKHFSDEKMAVKKEEIKMSTLSYYIKEKHIPKIDFIKIDVEGHELSVLKGLAACWEAKKCLIKNIQFEYGGTYLDSNTKLAEVFALLDSRYNVGKIENDTIRYSEFKPELEDYRYANYLAVLKT